MIVPIDYRPDGSEHFARLRALDGAVFLDSARPWSRGGRFDLMAAEPLCLLETRGDTTRATDGAGTRTLAGDPFALLEQELARRTPRERTLAGEWPFTGGAIGWFGYGLGSTRVPAGSATLPDMRVGIYGWALVQDHELQRAALVATPEVAPERLRQVQELLRSPPPSPAPFRLQGGFSPNLDRAAYARAFARVREYILAGDCYQVNLAQRLSAPAAGDPWEAYLRLRRRMASPFSGYMACGEGAVLSLSPERFLHLAEGRVETRPIKGTARRLASPAADRRQAEHLLASAKDRAENVMIVDLMRNDLGTACRTGSVHVEKLCALESYANVHHLVSVVTGELAPGVSATRLLANCFPGGSITGAPKIRAMQIIDELEPDPRSVYCGSLGYLSLHGSMDTSIAIRTLAWDGERIHAWGGGGIVADSDCETEYRECLTKIEPLLEVLAEGSAFGRLRDSAGSRA